MAQSNALSFLLLSLHNSTTVMQENWNVTGMSFTLRLLVSNRTIFAKAKLRKVMGKSKDIWLLLILQKGVSA